MSLANLHCASCKGYLLNSPMQCDCGDRLCGTCYKRYKNQNDKFTCPFCGEVNITENCFRDRAVEYELRNTTLKCLNPSCPWEGESSFYQEHQNKCKFGVVPCPNSTYGCRAELTRSKLEEHMKSECQFNPVTCQWCGRHTANQEIHLQKECDQVSEFCPNGCGERLPRREIFRHVRTVCTHQIRDCEYKDMGCDYKGTTRALAKYVKECTSYHNQLLKKDNRRLEQKTTGLCNEVKGIKDDLIKMASEFKQGITSMEQGMASFKSQVRQQLQEWRRGFDTFSHCRQPQSDHIFFQPMSIHLNGPFNQSRLAVRNDPAHSQFVGGHTLTSLLHPGQSNVSLPVQALQSDSIFMFNWKVIEVFRHRQEARVEETVSLCSAPFYTSRHGYKACLRLYMNGDESGKGSHLSFFITLMRGEYDALLPWPFRQAVTLTLVDQNKQKDIIQSFRPEPTSSSFQRPRNEMNIASGCPMFAPVSVLDNISYVKDDTMFLECKIDTTGLANE